MRWLITGGCGFIGGALIRRLVAEGGHGVRVVDNLDVGSRADLAAACGPHGFTEVKEVADAPGHFPERGVELLEGGILDEGLALEAVRGADVVVHLAASTGVAPSVADPRSDCRANVTGTLNYLEAARHARVGRFVFASSGAALGEAEPPLHEEKAPRPASPYGTSKLAGEGYCSAYHRSYGLEAVALRFGNVYGPGSGHKNSAVAKFVRLALAREAVEIYGDGTQSRDFVYVGDLVEAVYRAATVPGVGGETFQIATSAETTVLELVDELMRALALHGYKGVELRHASPRAGDVRRNYADVSKAARILGWRAEVGLDEGLRRTVGWFVERGAE